MDMKTHSGNMWANKLTYQTWRATLPQHFEYVPLIDETNEDNISEIMNNSDAAMNDLKMRKHHIQFAKVRTETNVNFEIWWQYLEMIPLLLMFTRSTGDGIAPWDLYLEKLSKLLLVIARYNPIKHFNSMVACNFWKTIHSKRSANC